MDERPNETGRSRYMAGIRYVGPRGITGRMIFGLVFMTLGALWTLDNLGLLESDLILRWWPAALVAFGVAKLTGMAGRNLVWGTLLVAVGSWWLAENFELVPHISFWQLWPLALVFIGVSMLLGAGRFTIGTRLRDMGRSNTSDDADHLSTFAVWGHVVRKVVSTQFRGGDASALMGGIDLDLRGAKPVPGGAVIEVLAIWGGIDVIVPSHWRVINQATVLMGAVEDKSKIPPSDATDTLILRGLVMMGGVEIKN